MQFPFARPLPGRTLLALACLAAAGRIHAALSATAVPVGVVKITVAAGTADAPTTTLFSVALAETPVENGAGRITGLTRDTLAIGTGRWTAGAFADPRQPRAVRVTSGQAAGQILPIAANNADSLTIRGTALHELGLAVGDTFDVVPLDTLDSLFGVDSLRGGTSAADADVVTLGAYTRDRYYFNTAAREWRRASGPATVNRGNTVILPGTAIEIARTGPSLTLLFTGRAPAIPFRCNVARAGNTYTGTGFPLPVTLRNLALEQRVPGWESGGTASTADRVAVLTDGAWVSYFHNGTSWVRAGASTAGADDTLLPATTALVISRRRAASGIQALVRPLPYAP